MATNTCEIGGGYSSSLCFHSSANHFDKTEMEAASSIKAIAIDLDGTFLSPSSEVSLANYRTHQALSSKGYKLFFATGRSLRSARFLTSVDNNSPGNLPVFPGAYLNGCIAYNEKGEIVHTAGIEENAYRQVIKLLEELQLLSRCVVFNENGLFVVSSTFYNEEFSVLEWEPVEDASVVSEEGLYGISCLKILIFSSDIKRIRTLIEPRLPPSLYCVFTSGKLLEILSVEATKGKAAEKLLQHWKLQGKNLMAIGDGENDIPILRLASISFAMGNASEACKSVAKYTTNSCGEDGFSHAMESIFSTSE